MQRQSADLRRTRDLLSETNTQLGIANFEAETARSQLSEAIEVIAQGFALFSPDDRLVMCNRHFCENLHDMADQLKPGLEFDRYLELVTTSREIATADQGGPDNWMIWRRQMHQQQQAVFNITLTDGRFFQVSSQRMSSGATVLIHSDVTHLVLNERRERDALMERQALLLQATLEHLDQAVCIFGTDGALIGQNQRLTDLLSIPQSVVDGALNQSWVLDHLRANARFLGKGQFEHLLRWAQDPVTQPPVSFELALGRDRTLSMSCKMIPSWGVVFTFTDISLERTAREAMRELNEQLERRVRERTEELGSALRKAERATATKSRYLAAASHDLMQPLSSAKLFVSAISDNTDSPEILDITEKADTSLAHLQDIIEALMDIARLDSDRVEMDVQPLKLNRVFQTLQDQFAPIAAAKGISLRIVPCDLLVGSDPGYLRRILENLIANAVRYTETGRVLVGVRRRGGRARIEVRDTGRGLEKADQSLIFEEFRKVDRRSTQGLGLGLAIVKRACAALNHPIDLWSELGKGSCFSVSVPILDAVWAADVRPDAGAGALAQPDCEGLIVLLVENDVQLSRAVAMQIEAWGGLVVPAVSAEDAISMLDKDGIIPDAMVLDYQLGDGMSGVSFFTHVTRRIGRRPSLIVTADMSETLLEDCLDAGLAFLNKPVDRAQLLNFLNDANRQRLAAAVRDDG